MPIKGRRLRSVAVWSVLGLVTLSGCASLPPAQPDNLCAVFREKPDWYRATREAQTRWGTPIATQMAFIYQESSYRADAQPPRKRILGFIPGRRASTSYGYSQATDTTWREYQRATGRWGADRDDFADSVDFIGWYNHVGYQRNRVAKNDIYRQYLAYHEGHGGFARGSYRNKQWLKQTARKVANRARRYHRQLQGCEAELRNRRGWWVLW